MTVAGRLRAGVAWRLRSHPWWRSDPPRRLKDLYPRGGVPESSVALTFDDGPDPTFTPDVLAALSDLRVRATFFMCGLAAERHPEIVRSVAAEGHTIGGHTWHHVDVRGLSDDDWRREVDDTHRALAAITGRQVRYFRPPWFAYDRTALVRLRARRLMPVLFSTAGRDWVPIDPGAIARNVAADLQPGAIVLLHDACGDLLPPGARLPPGISADRSATVAALPAIVADARAAGLTFTELPDRSG